jgi:putative membrane protein
MKVLLIMAVSMAAFANPAFADVPNETQNFIEKVAVSNKFEIDTSRLAQRYGKAPPVREFADRMISDHSQAGQNFQAALREAAIAPPSDSLDVAHTAKYAKLRVFTTEAGFDSAYIDEQLAAHEEAVSLFKNYSSNGPTPALKTFAQATLPTLEHHLQMVKEIRQSLSQGNAATGTSTGTTGSQ